MYVVRQAKHELEKVNKFNTPTVRPESAEGLLSGVLQVFLVNEKARLELIKNYCLAPRCFFCKSKSCHLNKLPRTYDPDRVTCHSGNIGSNLFANWGMIQ
jgi:hypothetical protein